MDEIIRSWAQYPVWGVVSACAVDSFYQSLTYAEALAMARRETTEPGRDATVVLVVSRHAGKELATAPVPVKSF